ncbi:MULTISPECIES: hypothetical protein [Sphingobium]|uniref:hypothetical protein n=1 Tax=Sphingobium TaxID=165695 RepID=UPI0002DA4B9B|nr:MULTISPECIES: hypothetical protein [Sphingobium]WQE07513.1 hypothetical protein U0025_01135 [Sphingobium yanoikuyae]
MLKLGLATLSPAAGIASVHFSIMEENRGLRRIASQCPHCRCSWLPSIATSLAQDQLAQQY